MNSLFFDESSAALLGVDAQCQLLREVSVVLGELGVGGAESERGLVRRRGRQAESSSAGQRSRQEGLSATLSLLPKRNAARGACGGQGPACDPLLYAGRVLQKRLEMLRDRVWSVGWRVDEVAWQPRLAAATEKAAVLAADSFELIVGVGPRRDDDLVR